MRDQKHLEFKVGLFINLGMALLLIAVLLLGSARSLVSTKNNYYLKLPNAAGLLRGAKVLIAGVPVGTVEDFDLNSDPGVVRVRLSIDKKYMKLLREDSHAHIESEGLVGDRVIALNPGSSSSPIIQDQGFISYQSGSDLNQVIGKGDELLSQLNLIAKNLNTLTQSFTTHGRSETIAQGAAATAKSLSALTSKIDRFLGSGKLDETLESTNRILSKLDHGNGTLGELINDPDLYDNAKSLVGETNDNRIARNLVRKAIENADKNQVPTS